MSEYTYIVTDIRPTVRHIAYRNGVTCLAKTAGNWRIANEMQMDVFPVCGACERMAPSRIRVHPVNQIADMIEAEHAVQQAASL